MSQIVIISSSSMRPPFCLILHKSRSKLRSSLIVSSSHLSLLMCFSSVVGCSLIQASHSLDFTADVKVFHQSSSAPNKSAPNELTVSSTASASVLLCFRGLCRYSANSPARPMTGKIIDAKAAVCQASCSTRVGNENDQAMQWMPPMTRQDPNISDHVAERFFFVDPQLIVCYATEFGCGVRIMVRTGGWGPQARSEA